MKNIFLLIVFIFAVSSVPYSSCKNNESELKINSEKNAMKTDIPVNKENKFYASSTKNNFPPENVFDYDDKTFWSPEKNGINEWLAVYIGNLETLGKYSACNLIIWDGYNSLNGVNEEYSKPTKYKIEFYVDENLILEKSISKSKINEESDYSGYVKAGFDFQILGSEIGALWIKIIILETDKKVLPAIRDMKLSFENANPHNAYRELNIFCNAVNKSDMKIISSFTDEYPQKLLEEFTNEVVPEEGPECSMESFEVHSEDIVSLDVAGDGDAESEGKVFFKYEKGKWKLYAIKYF